MALSTNQQASLWFAIIFLAALFGFGWFYYFESGKRAVDTDSKMYRGDPPSPALQNRDAEEGKPANPPLESAPRP